jgi:hypothetical protein
MYGAGNVFVGGGTINPNTFTHFAVTRSGNTVTVYVNGEQVAQNTGITGAYDNSGDQLKIGDDDGSSATWNGYIASLRIIKGQALTTGAFTPPTAPVTTSAVGWTGANVAASITGTVSLLCNFTNAGIFDNTGKNNLETVGNAQIDTSVKKFGTGSMKFDGTGDYLAFISNPDTTFGTGDFTIEGWFNSNSISTLQTIIERRSALTARGIAIFLETSTLKIRAGDTSTTAWEVTIDSGTLSSSTWYHFAVTRSGNTWRGFLDGTQIGSNVTWSGTVVDETSTWLIGAAFGGGAGMNGYIDDLRITKGVARYPTEPFPTKPFADR